MRRSTAETATQAQPESSWRVRPMKPTREQSQRQLPAVHPPPNGIFKHFTETLLGSVCESCGLRPNPSEPVIKIPGVRGVFCSNLCCEQGLIYDQHRCRACAAKLDENRSSKYCDDACRKFIADEPWGSGKRFLRWLALERPQLYREIFETAKSEQLVSGCLECGVPLDHKQSGARFCSNVHRMRFRKKSA